MVDSDGFWWILADSDVCRWILMGSGGWIELDADGFWWILVDSDGF